MPCFEVPVESPGDIYLYAGAHIDDTATDEISELIASTDPDVVAVELDHQRYLSLCVNPEQSTPSLSEWVAAGKRNPRGTAVSLALHLLQDRVYSSLPLAPGEADMLPAIEHADEHGAQVALIDQPFTRTQTRLADSINVPGIILDYFAHRVGWTPNRFDASNSQLQGTPFSQISSVEDFPRILSNATLGELRTFKQAITTLLPGGISALLHDRDHHMAARLSWLAANEYTTVAVIGALHAPGIIDSVTTSPTLDTPPISYHPFETTGTPFDATLTIDN